MCRFWVKQKGNYNKIAMCVFFSSNVRLFIMMKLLKGDLGEQPQLAVIAIQLNGHEMLEAVDGSTEPFLTKAMMVFRNC